MAVLHARAPAKVNLSLHIVRRRNDGWHEIESLTAFSASGDLLELDTDAPEGLEVLGPHGNATGPLKDNLVLKATRMLRERASDIRTGAFRLVKKLPAAAGIGGGSSDAGAALRLLARANAIAPDDPRLVAAAAAVGADVPVCLAARARMMRGLGDELGPVLELPSLFAVLVNPGAPVVTSEAFARLGLAPGESYAMSAHPLIETGMGAAALISALRRTRNDMEDAASVLAPVIGDVLAILGAARGCAVARMSGSGATCFGLFETQRAASRAAGAIRKARPLWWVKGCVLR